MRERSIGGRINDPDTTNDKGDETMSTSVKCLTREEYGTEHGPFAESEFAAARNGYAGIITRIRCLYCGSVREDFGSPHYSSTGRWYRPAGGLVRQYTDGATGEEIDYLHSWSDD